MDTWPGLLSTSLCASTDEHCIMPTLVHEARGVAWATMLFNSIASGLLASLVEAAVTPCCLIVLAPNTSVFMRGVTEAGYVVPLHIQLSCCAPAEREPPNVKSQVLSYVGLSSFGISWHIHVEKAVRRRSNLNASLVSFSLAAPFREQWKALSVGASL
eukprot:6492350-Amphidinium_carterae.3